MPVTSIGYAAPGAVLGVGILIPLAVLDHVLADLVENTTGIDIGLILTGSAFALVLAYTVRFFAIAQGAADAAMGRVSPNLSLAARLTLTDVEVDADAVIGEVDGGEGLLEGALNLGRACAASSLTGAGDQAFRITMEYLKTRKQFGRAIGEFQALQHRAAHLFSEIEIARAATLGALQKLDAGDEAAPLAVAVAKAKAGRVAELAVQEAVQMHGGVGMTDEFDVGLFVKRVRVLNELLGDTGFHQEAVARSQGF